MAEMAWVRQLARALVRDVTVADDIAQDAFVVASEHQPDTGRPLRPWLARVVTNLVRTRRTSDSRRERRNVAYGDDRAVPTPAELVERVELHRVVAEEVLALSEPYRSTVLLCFFEGYSSADIGRKLGIPDGTVRRRLKVALDQLREALRKRTDQPKGGWLAALAPIARPPAAATGVIVMKKVLVLFGLLLLLVLAGAVWRHRAHTGSSTGASSSATSDPRQVASAAGVPAASTAIPDWIPQAGAPPRRLAGRVMFRGTPVAGARVVLGLNVMGEPTKFILEMSGEMPNILQPVAVVSSAADGAFDFGVQPPIVFTVSASATDHSAATVRVENQDPHAKTDQLVLALGDCSSRLSGTVADASGGGIVKARISARGASGTESDAAGKYNLCLSPRDALGTPSAVVRVEADGYGTIAETVIVDGNLHHDFQLVPEAVLAGRVTTSDGEPVAGARVIATIEPREIAHHLAGNWVDSDRDGRFRIVGLGPGSFQLGASARGMTMNPIPVVAQPAKTSQEIHVVLTRRSGARVSGHVYTKDAAAPGVFVQAVQGGKIVGGATSQADGSFVIDSVPYGATSFFAGQDQPNLSKQVAIDKAVVDNVRVDVAKPASVHGHVTHLGKPVAGADILYLPAPQATMFGGRPTAKADASGAYSLELPAGVGQLVAFDNAGKAFANPQLVTVASSEDKTVDIELDFSGEVRGSVVDEAGTPVSGIYMRLDLTDNSGDMCESITDVKGQFDCTMLVGGDYRATVTPGPGVRQGFAPATGDHFDTIKVPKSGAIGGVVLAIKDERLAIRGSVVDDTGAPIADVHIEAAGPGDQTMDFPSTLSDASGHFELGNLARGKYRLVAHAADGSEGELAEVASGSAPVSIALGRAGAVEGTLIGFSTPPVVFVSSPGQPERAIVEGTSFSRRGLRPGQYAVQAMVGTQADAQSIEIKPGETVHVDLRSRDVGTVEGTVSEFGTHGPLAGLRCDAHLSVNGQMSPIMPDASQQAFTDASGHFAVTAPTGRVRIFCFSPGPVPLSPAGTDVDVASGGRATVSVFAVRATLDGPPGDAGFTITPAMLPLTIDHVIGPAAAAGLRVGDQVTAIDGKPLDGVLPAGAMTLIANHRSGTTVTVGISRGGATQMMKLPVR